MASTVCVRSLTSAAAKAVTPPACLISSASDSSLSLRRARSPTLQPSAASTLANAQPMPLDAPVTTVTWLEKADMISGSFEDEAGITAAEAERVGNGNADPVRSCLMRNVVEGTSRIGLIKIDGGRDCLAFDRHDAGERFDGS